MFTQRRQEPLPLSTYKHTCFDPFSNPSPRPPSLCSPGALGEVLRHRVQHVLLRESDDSLGAPVQPQSPKDRPLAPAGEKTTSCPRSDDRSNISRWLAAVDVGVAVAAVVVRCSLLLFGCWFAYDAIPTPTSSQLVDGLSTPLP